MANTVAGILLTGIFSARPAASTVSAGTLYAASDTGLIYQSDGVSSWTTWATLGTSGAIVNPMTTLGDIIYGSAVVGGVATPARQGIGGSNTVLHGGAVPPSYSAVTETDFSFADITTTNATTSKHGLLPKLNGSNATFLNGTGAFSTPAGGGSLEVKEIDGSPDVSGVTVIQVSNGTLTNNGSGNVTITTGGGGGGGGVSVPAMVQSGNPNGNSQNPTVTVAAAASGHSFLFGWNGTSRGVTSLTQTNVTWTKMNSYTSGGGSHYELWVGIVAGGSSGTSIAVATGSSNYWSAAWMEIPDALTPTMGGHVQTAMPNYQSAFTPLTGVTAGHLVVTFFGPDNTSNYDLVMPNVPWVTAVAIGGSGASGCPLCACYAPTGGVVQVVGPYGQPQAAGAGGGMIVEIT